jgi:lipopolysaccharide transport system permease protein
VSFGAAILGSTLARRPNTRCAIRFMNSPATSSLNPLATLWRHRDLLSQFSRRNIEQRHRGSFLGIFWTILTPLLSLAIYTFVFGFIFSGKFHPTDQAENGRDYALAIFIGLIFFNFLAEVLALSPSVIVTQPNFVKKVVFPLEVLPAATVAAAGFAASINLALALLGVRFLGHGLDWHALVLLLIAPPVILIALGCAWFISSLGVFIRDIGNAMPFLVQVLVYMSAVFYPLSFFDKIPPWVPHWVKTVLLCNPLLQAVESARRVVLWHTPVSSQVLILLWVVGIVVCAFGYFVFNKLRPTFADVL